jgi:glutamate/tyrosine decarboxylase-like PLP-dependent enzyme
VCQKHGVWLHVDGAWGGSVLVSKKWRHKMAGVERADSVTWCLHKMMGINQQCAAFLTKESHLLVCQVSSAPLWRTAKPDAVTAHAPPHTRTHTL